MILLFKVAIILLVGYIGGVLANRLKLPNVSGYLIFGLILGPSLGLIFSVLCYEKVGHVGST